MLSFVGHCLKNQAQGFQHTKTSKQTATVQKLKLRPARSLLGFYKKPHAVAIFLKLDTSSVLSTTVTIVVHSGFPNQKHQHLTVQNIWCKLMSVARCSFGENFRIMKQNGRGLKSL